MNIAVCIDDRGGMLFNRRRQSRDSILLEKLVKKTTKLYILPFSEKMMASFGIPYVVVSDPCDVPKGETLFVENCSVAALLPHASTLTVYKWNREYPGDFFLDLDLSKMLLASTEEFAGKSHEKITEEIYKL